MTGEIGGKIGDTTAFRLRIVSFRGLRDHVTYEIAEPAHLIFLEVVPGRRIELVRDVPVDTAMTRSGTYDMAVFAQSDGFSALEPWRVQDDVEFRRCLDRVRRATPRKTRVIRDKDGKEIVERTSEAIDPGREIEAERQCEAAANRQSASRRRTGRVEDRYLLVIASNVRLTPIELTERLTAMTVLATDVPSTMAAIPEALFVDRRARWSGYYARW